MENNEELRFLREKLDQKDSEFSKIHTKNIELQKELCKLSSTESKLDYT